MPVSIPQWCDCCGAGYATIEVIVSEFQSHNGAIAANLMPSSSNSRNLVSIPQWCDCCYRTKGDAQVGHERFNPTMVRLLPSLGIVVFSQLHRFQSHNGAIAACLGECCECSESAVSIPQWCDCCPKVASILNRFAVCFNPTMVRLLPKLIHDALGKECMVSIPQWCDCCRSWSIGRAGVGMVSIPQWCDCC